MFYAPGGVVDANCLLLLKDGVGLLTDGGGHSGGVGCCGASDVAGARGLLSLGLGSVGGCIACKEALSELSQWS